MYSAHPRLVEEMASTQDGVHIELLRSKNLQEGIPVILVPGMLGTAPMFADRMDMLQPRPAIAFSHRGCGKSSSPTEGHYDFASRCLDIDAVVNFYQLKEYFLYGFSRGVAMAVQHALQNPGHIKGLVLDDAEPVYPRLTRAWFNRINDAQFLWAHPFALERIQKESVECDLYDRLGEIKAPVLIFRGEMDGSMLTKEAAEDMQRRLAKAEIVTLANSGHGASAEDFPLFRDAMLEF